MWQNVNNEVLLAWFKFQAKIPSRSGVCVQGEELKNTGHSMSIRNPIFGVSSVTVSDLICYDSLLQNATDVITKCDSYFITKHDRNLLQNVSGFLLQNATVLLQNATILLQNATVIIKCDVYYKLRQYTTLHFKYKS